MDSGNNSQPPVAGLLLVALVLGTVFFIEPPLQGSRPTDPPKVRDLSSGEQTIPARLWQDPFEAITLNQRAGKDSGAPGSGAQSADPSVVESEPMPGECNTDFARMLEPDRSNQGKGVLLVMTPGSPYVEDGERRIRARYAVISALGVAGLSPRFSQHIGCTRVQSNNGDFDIPFEWFDAQDQGESAKKNSVLVVWLPEEKFSISPLAELSELVSTIRIAGNGKTSIAVIGPQGSGTLKKMRSELQRGDVGNDFAGLRDVRFYSPSATMDERFFSEGAHKLKTFAQLFGEKVSQRSTFFKTILSDSENSNALIVELERRGLEFNPNNRTSPIKDIWFNATEPLFQSNESCRIFEKHRDHVVLISELDTLYGRSFPEAFVHAARDYAGGHDDQPRWIHRFSYLRGLDGQVPAKVQGKSSTTGSTRKSATGTGASEELSRIKRASNTPRFDYLRRLSGRVKRLDNALRSGYCGSIKAIGVLGSDVYDKLLILQALREKFPNVLFFTADMDARFLHPAEFQWTRNLIVASSHGLEPDLSFDGDIPPFRDSYQTSRFLATLLALSKYPTPDQEFINQKLRPVRVYEIGRAVASDLTVIARTDKTTNRRSTPADEEKTAPANPEERESESGNNNSSGSQMLSLLDGTWSGHVRHQQADTSRRVELAASETITEFLKVHDVKVRSRFDPLQTSTFPGWFVIIGSLLAGTLFLFGAGYYLRGYLGLHPAGFMNQLVDSVKSDASESRTDLHLVFMSALLWTTLLLIALINLSAFLLVGILIVVTIFLGRISTTVRERVLKLLQYQKVTIWVALGLFALSLFWAARYFSQNPLSFSALAAGEPFSLSVGISMWPGEFVRIIAGVVAIGYMLAGWRSLKKGDQQLTKEFFPTTRSVPERHYKQCAVSRRTDWCCGEDAQSTDNSCQPPFDARTNWLHYRFYRSLSERWNSVLFPATLFFLLGCISIYWLDDFHTPYRGVFVYHFDQFVVFGFMVPSFLLLLFAVIDETSLCVGWVRRLTKEFNYQSETSYFLSKPNGKPDLRSKPDRDLDEIWTRLQVVARRTRRVGKLIVGPFVVLFLMLVSQSPYFDNWDIPAGLIVMIMISAAYAIMCAIKLRKVTEEARRAAIQELTRQLIERGGKDDKIELLLDEARQIQDGGFLPWTRQPWLKAVLWLFSAFGIMSAEYISLGALG